METLSVRPDARQFMCISANSSDGFLVIHVGTGDDVCAISCLEITRRIDSYEINEGRCHSQPHIYPHN